MFGSSVGFLGSADLMVQLSNFRNRRWQLTPSWMSKNGHNFVTGLPIDVMFGFRVLFGVFPSNGATSECQKSKMAADVK